MEAAFFDLDKTVIAKPSMVAFGRPLYDAGMISRATIVRALWSNFLFQRLGADEERMRKFRQSALRITRGWDQALVSSIVRDTLAEVIEPIVYAEALDLIQEHQRAGRRVFLVSASPEEIVAPLAQFLGVDEAISSRAELDDQGRYTGNVEFWSYGPYKVEAMRAAAERYGIDLTRSYAYSDSGTDIPMLETVGVPVAVNPDRELARVARDRGWETRWFEHGVPLRDRVNMPRPGKAAAVVGGVLVLGAAGMVAWWWVDQRRSAAPGAAAPKTPAPAPAGRRALVDATLAAPVDRLVTAVLGASSASVAAIPTLISALGRTREAPDVRRLRPWPAARGRSLPTSALDGWSPPWVRGSTRPAASSPQRRPERTGRRSR
jgi:HAD superfamily hydrolase (TIGR01490 family)